VPCGGKFDGNLGVLAGIEVARTLQEHHITLNHPYEVIVFADEEDTMIGGRAMAGTASFDAHDYRRKDGRPIDECVNQIGGDWANLAQARRTREDICAFVELHVEQGCVLETAGKQIGVVEGVVGYSVTRFMLKGVLTMPVLHPWINGMMPCSRQPRWCCTVNRLATNPPGQRVATVGALQVWPNAANIVPGKVQASLDVRDLDRAVINQLVEDLKTEMEGIATATQTRIWMVPQLDVAPSPAATHIQSTIAEVSEGLGTQLSIYAQPSRP
jgi:N-carbamoyl-L-amino-acid hydrolase